MKVPREEQPQTQESDVHRRVSSALGEVAAIAVPERAEDITAVHVEALRSAIAQVRLLNDWTYEAALVRSVDVLLGNFDKYDVKLRLISGCTRPDDARCVLTGLVKASSTPENESRFPLRLMKMYDCGLVKDKTILEWYNDKSGVTSDTLKTIKSSVSKFIDMLLEDEADDSGEE